MTESQSVPPDVRQRLRVPFDQLSTHVDPAQLGYASTQEVSPLEGMIGQERALRALEFGIGVDAPGFNIFVAGGSGSGRNTTLARYLQRAAASMPIPDDWVYVYNFREAMKPRGMSLPAGMGRQLEQDMAELLDDVRARLPRAFESDDYSGRMEAALAAVRERHRQLTEEMMAEARKRGMALNVTEAGIGATPLGPEGKPMEPQEFEALPPETKERLREEHQGIQDLIAKYAGELRQLEKEAAGVRQQVNREVAEFVVQGLFTEMQQRYAECAEVIQYLDDVLDDMVRNFQAFLAPPKEGPQQPAPTPFAPSGPADEAVRYRVNVFVDHARSTGAPVIFEHSPSYYNIFGRVEHAVRMGMMSSDFTMVQAGSIHRANGGFLVLQANEALANPQVWQTLKQVLRSGEARIETLGEQMSLLPTSSQQPEPMPLDLKVVLVGNPGLARMLLLHDEDYQRHFKVKAEFGYDVDLNTENLRKFAMFVVNRIQEGDLPHFDASAIARMAEFSSRLVEDQAKLTTQFAVIADMITEAAYWARQAGQTLVRGEDVLQAIQERQQRSNLVEERLQDLYNKGVIRVDVDGAVVGQVNGLAVIDMGDYSFGRPSRVTARVGLGRGEFANVEHISQMSGRIHSKGFAILIGYMMQKYGLRTTLPFRASIAFEQTYEAVDGDSASSTEVYALLSALSQVPIRQGLAVTGSVDQQGMVQAIGGATRKIEGFYEVCKAKGMTGDQGVLVPSANIHNLVLDGEVVEAVRAGRFHVFAADTIDEGIELLTGVPAGVADVEGHYPEGTINAKVMDMLDQMAERLRSPERNNRAARDGGQAPPPEPT
ncbi:MAG: ATP-binding protein, partial [Dehalococcoidia bacterium]